MENDHNTGSNPKPVRFVTLLHRQSRGDHYDLMIDCGNKLSAWKMLQPPETAAGAPLTCVRTPDHRRLYLDYEGPVSGNRGRVTQHDTGACRINARSDTQWDVTFAGVHLCGRYIIEQTDQSREDWLMRFRLV